MRKILLSAIALMMTATMLAVGTGDGKSQSNAIDFDWENGKIHKAGTAALWYRVDLSPLKSVEDPTLALYLTNLTEATSAVNLKAEASVTVLGQTQSGSVDKNYSIAGKDYVLWSLKGFNASGRELTLKSLMTLGLKEVYLQLQSTQDVVLAAKVYETEEIVDDACTQAIDFDWNGVEVAAGEQWFRLNLAEVKANGDKLKFVVANNGATEAHVAFDMSLDCPASAVIENDWVIASGEKNQYDFGRVFLNVLDEDYVFVKLTNDQPITLSVEQIQIDKTQGPVFEHANAAALAFEQANKLEANKGQVYAIAVKNLIAGQNEVINLVVKNKSAQVATFTAEVAFTTPVWDVIEQSFTIAANGTEAKLVKDNILKTINANTTAYIRFTADQEVEFELTKEAFYPCENAIVFDWNTGVKHEAGTSAWYELDVTPVLETGNSVQLTFTNHSDAVALVTGEIALNCPGTTIPFTCPVPAGMSVQQVVNANLFAASRLQHCYVNITSDMTLEVKAAMVPATIDTDACQKATTIEQGVEYNQAAGTTQWYRVTDQLIDEISLLPRFTFQNKGANAANITVGITLNCEYDILTQATVKVPTWLDFTTYLTSIVEKLADKVVNQNITEYYVQITTTEPILFGWELNYGNYLGCDHAQVFDWNKGAVLPARDAKWFEFDTAPLKANKQQVKLTFTNHADSIAWVVAAITRDCPWTVAMPLVFPVPAGASVDKWVDYSFIAASEIEQFYVAAYSDSDIELAAVAEDATITPVEGCLNATEVMPNVEYTVQPGVDNWFLFTEKNFHNSSDDPRFYLANRGEKRATFTMGATIGCEYGILTHGKMIVPSFVDHSLRIPRWVFGILNKFIDSEVQGFYTHITTNEPLAFKIEMEMNREVKYETIYPCLGTEYTNHNGDKVLVELDKVITDTVWVDGEVDSIITVLPMVAPVLTKEILTSIGAVPTLVRGQMPDAAMLAASEALIMAYFQEATAPGIAEVYSVKWQAEVVSETEATQKMTLMAADECSNATPYPFEFELSEIDTPDKPDDPKPDPCDEVDPLPAVSKYGHRLLVLNLTAINERYPGFQVEENAVAWYQVGANGDTFLGNGFYYTKDNGEPLNGQFYALVTMPVGFECHEVPTIILNCNGVAAAPMLVPNVVTPSEAIRLINLDPEQVSNISVYSTTGELVAQFSASNTEEISFEAAQIAGYYIVEVQTEVEKISLRYVVK